MHKYRLVAKKGEGTFSEVLKAQCIKNGKYVAIKCMKNHFDSLDQVNNLREIQALRRLSPHPHIIRLLEVLYDQPTGRLALVFELMDMNIYELIRGRRHYVAEERIKNYMYQLMKAMDHMHRNGIFHRDIKPENILIMDDCLKLADFGSCRGIYSKQPYTEYISTRWYRAPECLLTDGYYNYKMDMWGVGCVFFEIVALFPLFPGTNELDQIQKIHNILGTPPPELLAKFKRRSAHIDFNFPPKEGTGIAKLIPHCSPECIDLVTKLLAYNPDDRLSARQALRHAYFKDLRDAEKRQKAPHSPELSTGTSGAHHLAAAGDAVEVGTGRRGGMGGGAHTPDNASTISSMTGTNLGTPPEGHSKRVSEHSLGSTHHAVPSAHLPHIHGNRAAGGHASHAPSAHHHHAPPPPPQQQQQQPSAAVHHHHHYHHHRDATGDHHSDVDVASAHDTYAPHHPADGHHGHDGDDGAGSTLPPINAAPAAPPQLALTNSKFGNTTQRRWPGAGGVGGGGGPPEQASSYGYTNRQTKYNHQNSTYSRQVAGGGPAAAKLGVTKGAAALGGMQPSMQPVAQGVMPKYGGGGGGGGGAANTSSYKYTMRGGANAGGQGGTKQYISPYSQRAIAMAKD